MTSVVPRTERSQRAELVGVVHGGGQADEVDLGRREDQHLLPDTAAVGVLNEVHLIEDDRVQARKEIRARQEHVAQHLGGHHHHGGVGAHRGVTGEKADVFLAVGGDELAVLLVRERLERRGVEGLAARPQGPVDAVGGHERLARPGRGGDQDRVVGVDRRECVALEVVGRKGKLADEVAFLVRHRDGPREDVQRPASFPIPIEMK